MSGSIAETAARPPITLCLAGVTGEVGRALAAAVLACDDLRLVSAVARSAAGRKLGEVVAGGGDAPVRGSVEQALAEDRFDVLVDYTAAPSLYDNARRALDAGVAVVVGGSGISAEELALLDRQAQARGLGVIHGNFSLSATLAQMLAAQAAKFFASWEIIEYGHATKADAVSATVRELAERLAAVAPPQQAIAPEDFAGDTRARGATVRGSQVHALRLPGATFSFEVLFGKPQERLTIRHDTFDRAAPYVDGTLLAVRRIGDLTGLHLGLDTIMAIGA